MAIRPCIQGCRFPRPGKGSKGVLQSAGPEWGQQAQKGEGRPQTPRAGAVLEAVSQLPEPEETFWGGRGGKEHPSEPQ